MTTAALPPGLLLSFYGDDFTGSAAVMEVMTFAGLPAVLFLGPPTAYQLAEFTGYRAMGIAGVARAKDPAWMTQNLPDIFATLAGWQAPIAHYKVCSTFDSAPHIGSIGHAIDIAVPLLGGRWHPLLVAAPAIHRYQAFGNLFAAVDHVGYRLDRHPTMSRHPTTPMNEADVTRHLAHQTDKQFGLVDFLALRARTAKDVLDSALTQGAEVVAIDILDQQTLVDAGRLIWQNRGERLFVIGSQGIEYALTAYWQDAGLIPPAPPPPNAGPVDNMVVVSGSCSPETGSQIAWATENGFTSIGVDAALAVDPQSWAAELTRATQVALQVLSAGNSPILHTASGPNDPAIARFNTALDTSGLAQGEVAARVGAGLGQMLADLLARSGLHRCVIAGGDTSSYAAPALGLYALTALAQTVPGAALAKAHCASAAFESLEISLKGGQMGTTDIFSQIRNGGR